MTRVLVTSAGGPGGYALVRALKSYDYEVVTTDVREHIGAASLADDHHITPPRDHPGFLKSLPRYDYWLPCNSEEAYLKHRSIDVWRCLDKHRLYSYLRDKAPHVLPMFWLSKPTQGAGGRGHALFMEYLEPPEYHVDVLMLDEPVILPRLVTDHYHKDGTLLHCQLVDNPVYKTVVRELLPFFAFEGVWNFQFMGGKLLEINPRISSQLYTKDWCLPHLMIEYALTGKVGEYTIPWGAEMKRYFTQETL